MLTSSGRLHWNETKENLDYRNGHTRKPMLPPAALLVNSREGASGSIRMPVCQRAAPPGPNGRNRLDRATRLSYHVEKDPLKGAIPMKRSAALLVLVIASALLISGCGNNETSEPQVLVTLTPDQVAIPLCAVLDIIAEVENAEDTRLGWFVNDIAGGNATCGTITQTNPAHYSAPIAMPDSPEVVIKAVPLADLSQEAICVVTLQVAQPSDIYVNASTGSDVTGTGCALRPFRSIRRGLEVASPGKTVHVAPGLYDEANGEAFPLEIPDSVALVGQDWETTIIRGHSSEASYCQTFRLAGTHIALRKFTLEQGDTSTTKWRVAILVPDPADDVLVDSIRVSEKANYSIVRMDGALNATVSNCRFVREGVLTGRGFEISEYDPGSNNTLRGCTISGYYTGLHINYWAEIKIEGCTIDNGHYGIELCCLDDDMSKPNPDLGGGARGSLGGNVIRNHVEHGLRNTTPNMVYARYNTWTNDPPTVGGSWGTDIFNEGTGTTIWE
jgi:hypothetical protein